MIRHRSAFVTCIGLLMLVCSTGGFNVHAQKRSRLSPPSAVRSPKSVLGFEPGDERTIADWSQITDYFARLDKASDRVIVETIGVSTLKRPIIVAIISAHQNILKLDAFKEAQRRLSDPRLVKTDQERELLIQDGKTVVTISCSIHSTEIVASQMSMELAYQLATADDADTREILQNTILLLNPSANPDGVDIVSNWYRKTLGTPSEGREPPELYHHYAGHDDNRDWFMINLKETEVLTHLLWKEWFPQIVYDVHQQGSNGSRFFVPPFFDPQNPNIDPLLLRQVALVGHKMAADLQAAGYHGVITNSLYDTWWHGGFRTTPYFHNSIGILSEAASARLMSPATVTREQLARSSTRGMRNALEATTNFPDPWPGGEWKAGDILEMEIVAARSLLSLAAKYRANYLRDFYELGKKNVSQVTNENDPVAYLIPAGQARDEAVAKLVTALVEQGVEVFRLDHELHATFGPQVLQRTNSASERLGVYRRIVAATAGMHEVPAGSYIVFLSQPQRSNVITLFEPQIYPDRLNAQGEAERPYDVAGWTLPLQMGVEAPAVLSIQETPNDRKLTLIREGNEVRDDLSLRLKKTDRSPIANPINRPVRIGVYKSWVANMDEGWTRYIFDTFNVPYTSVTDADIRSSDLATRYDALLLPSQRARDIIEGNSAENYPKEFAGGITAAGVENLKRFVEKGGALVCFDAACELAIKQFNLPVRNALEGLRTSEFYCPGSIVALDVDNTLPLARRMPRNTVAYFINSQAFESTDPKVRVVAHYAK